MLDNTLLKDLSDRLAAVMPVAGEIRDEMRIKIEQTLKKAFADLDLMTRDEFESQSQALERAMLRIDELENVLAELDSRVTGLESGSD